MRKNISILINPILEFYNNSFLKIFFIVGLLNLISTVVFNHVVWSDVIYLNESGLDKSSSTFSEGSDSRSVINLIVDLISPVWLFIKLGIASVLIFLIAYIFQISISLINIFKSSLVSFIFIVFGDVVCSAFLIFINPPLFRNDILYFYPLSLLHFIETDSSLYSYYFIWARINLFQVVFIISLFLIFRNGCELSVKNSIILSSAYVGFYVLFLVFWFLFSI